MYVVDQKVGKHIYVYEVNSYWDKHKKSPRQQRTKIGKRDPVTGELIRLQTRRQSFEYGSIYFIASLVEQLGIKELLYQEIPDKAREILLIAAFQVAEHKSLYLCNSWLEHIYLEKPLQLPSQSISRLLHALGEDDTGIYRFLEEWAKLHTDSEFIVFDITSLSTYSKEIDFAEWGYNRDGEKLAQINFGVVYSEPSNLPLLYSLYPGSVPDVVTLKNIKKRLEKISGLKTLFVLDRGFYSTKNIEQLYFGSFIIPLPMGTKIAKNLVSRHHSSISDPQNAFKLGKEIYYALNDTISFGEDKLAAHLFYSQKKAVDERERLINELLNIEEDVRARKWKSSAKLIRYLEDNWPGWHRCFYLKEEDVESFILLRKRKNIEQILNNQGIFILLTNTSLTSEQVLSYYRRKDGVEKLFDSMKHGTGMRRLRVHSRKAMEGLLFIEFISLILYSSIQKTLRESSLGKNLTVEQMFYELKKLSVIEIDDKKPIITELTRKQKEIFNAFKIQLPIMT